MIDITNEADGHCTHPRPEWTRSHINRSLVGCGTCGLIVRDDYGVPLDAVACGVVEHRLTEDEARAILEAEEVCENEGIGPDSRASVGKAWDAMIAEARARLRR